MLRTGYSFVIIFLHFTASLAGRWLRAARTRSEVEDALGVQVACPNLKGSVPLGMSKVSASSTALSMACPPASEQAPHKQQWQGTHTTLTHDSLRFVPRLVVNLEDIHSPCTTSGCSSSAWLTRLCQCQSWWANVKPWLVLRPLAYSEHIELRIPSAHAGLAPYNYTQRPRGLAAPCPGSSISCPLANRIQDSVTLTLCLESIGEKTAPKPPTQLFLSSYANFCAMRCHSCYPVHRHAESGNACS